MLSELARHAYELADFQSKALRVVVRGGGAEVERSVLDELWEPVVHLVRNAVDHGIEVMAEREGKPAEALLTLEAHTLGGYAVITIRDDGRGIDPEMVRSAALGRRLVTAEAAAAMTPNQLTELLFVHGFSTRGTVTELSGRGVGLDVVRRKVEALGGNVSMSSDYGRGTQCTLTVPATISKERALVVECGDALFGIPSRHVVEVVRLADCRVERAAAGTVLRYRDDAVPLRSLSAAVTHQHASAEPWAILLDWGGRVWAFGIPALAGEEDLVRRPVDPLVSSFGHIAASAIHHDGRLILLLLVGELIRLSDSRRSGLAPAARAERRREQRRVLIVDDSAITGDLVSEILAGAGLEVELALDGQAALTMIEARMPDLVLSDIDMPVMNGFELLKHIRGRWPHLPVVVLSTRASPDDRREASALGANAYIVKSAFHETTLIDTVKRFLGQAA
jgi:chemotaxis protein histidine kinase CheA/CheY-like chemotaxis protein